MSDQAPGPSELMVDNPSDNEFGTPWEHKQQQQQQQEVLFRDLSESSSYSNDSGYRSDTASRAQPLKSAVKLEPSHNKRQVTTMATARSQNGRRSHAYARNEHSLECPTLPEDLISCDSIDFSLPNTQDQNLPRYYLPELTVTELTTYSASPTLWGTTDILGSKSSPGNSLEEQIGQSQTSFSTDSSLPDDATDWEEDSDQEQSYYQPNICGPSRLADEFRETILQNALDPMKKAIVDRLMDEFWVVFNQNWQSGVQLCPSGSGSSPSTSGRISSAQGASEATTGGSGNAQNNGERNDGTDDNREKEGSEPSNPPGSHANLDKLPGFACPYRKRNPLKYCLRDWRTCALSPLKTIARVKGHLYRCHMIHQCPRCRCLFSSDEELDSHIMASERCDAILSLPVDGITNKMKAALQCKRKSFPGQTEPERWKQIYQILFPGEEVPDPYFEQVRDMDENRGLSPDCYANYEQFLRRNVPQLVRSALFTELNNEIQPLEERLREQLPGLVENVLSRAFLEYHTIINENRNGERSSDSGYASNRSRAGSSKDPKGKESVDGSQPETASAVPAADLGNRPDAPDALLPPNLEPDPIASSFESLGYQQQNFENIDSLDYSQFDFPQLYNEAFPDSPFCFSNQVGGLESSAVGNEDNWSFPLPGGSTQPG